MIENRFYSTLSTLLLLIIGVGQLTAQNCSCTDYAYVPDFQTEVVHKFEILPDGSYSEIGAPWANIGSPHGTAFLPDGSLLVSDFNNYNYDLFDCAGNNLGNNLISADGAYNAITIDNILYIVPRNDECALKAYDMCDNYSFVGEVTLNNCNGRSWGSGLGPDGFIYIVDNYFGNGGNGDVYKIDPDLSNFTNPASSSSSPFISGLDRLFGIQIDAAGNIYVMEQATNNASSTILKFDSSGNLLCSISDTNNNQSGFYNGWGLALSPDGNSLYVTSFSEDCVAQISTSCPMSYMGATVAHEPNTSAKGIRIVQECCPTTADLSSTTNLCGLTEDEILPLPELINCEGIICEAGTWVESGTGTGIYLDACEQTITVETSASGCNTFTASSDGAGLKQCGAFDITIEVCHFAPIAPVLAVTDNNCEADTDGSFSITTPCEAGYTIEYSTDGGTTWSATLPAYADGVSLTARCVNDTDVTCFSEASTPVVAEGEACSPCESPGCDPVPSEEVCDDGSDSLTLSCDAGSTDIVWYNSSGIQVGTGCNLIVDNSLVGTGVEGQSECFYYEGMDANGCEGVSCCPINVTVISCCVDPDPGTNGTLVICPGATVTAAELFAALGGTPATGGVWSPALAGAGTYTYTIVGVDGCSDVSAQVIVSEVGPVILSLSPTGPLCNGDSNGSIDASVAGGTGIVTFAWSTGATSEDISGLAAGTYDLTITDANGCSAESSVTLTDPTVLSCTVTHTDVTDCDANDGTMTVSGVGGTPNYNYSQDGIVFTNVNTFSNLMAGNHTVYVEDANGCVSSCMATILAPTTPMCMISNIVNITCNGAADGSFDVSGSGGNGSYEFSEDNVTFNTTTSYTGLSAGSYTIYVRNLGQPNCISMCNTLITEPDPLSCVTASVNVLCFGEATGSITVTPTGGSGGYEYSIDGTTFQASNMFSSLAAGVYTITIRDTADPTCTHTCPAAITEPPLLAPMTSATDIECNGESTGTIDLDVTGGTLPLTYDWDIDGPDTPDDDPQDPTGLAAGTYTVTVTDANGCTVVATQVVTEPTPLTCSTTSTDLSANGAGDGTATVTGAGGTPAYTYAWSDGQTTMTATALAAGMYTVTVTDMNGCEVICDVTIEEPPCVQLGGEIFYDLNENGCEDPGEALVTEAIMVSLYECGDIPGTDVPAGITMIMDGDYVFGEGSPDPGADICLEEGSSYFVVFDIPNAIGESLEEYTFTNGTADATCAPSGEADDVDPMTAQSGCYDPADGDAGDGADDENIDAGIVPPCEELAGEIFYDDNINGCEDPGEALVMVPVTVDLYPCGSVPGVNQPIATTTVSDGDYVFGENSTDPGADICLEAGTQYFVVFDIPNGAGEALEDYVFTPAVASGPCTTSGESDNVDPTTGASGCYDPNDDDAGDSADDQDIDAGIVAPCHEIAGEIFYDLNENGCEDSGEALVTEAVNVTLYECGDVPGTDPPAASTTVTDGMYEFSETSTDPGAAICLDDDVEYFVVFDIPNAAGEVLEDYTFTSGTADMTCMDIGEADDVDTI